MVDEGGLVRVRLVQASVALGEADERQRGVGAAVVSLSGLGFRIG